MSWWKRAIRWIRGGQADRASSVLREMRAENRRPPDAEWARLRNRLGVLVLSETDQQRLWRRAHHGSPHAPRLLSGITHPTDDEKSRLLDLIEELERGR